MVSKPTPRLTVSRCSVNLQGEDRSEAEVLTEDALNRVGKTVGRVAELAVLLLLGDAAAQPTHVIRHDLDQYLKERLWFSLLQKIYTQIMSNL